MQLLRASSIALCLIATTACTNTPKRSDNVVSAQERVFNPVTRNYEWQTPGKPPTSPGADRTSRQSYR